jgi:hypothetical protein
MPKVHERIPGSSEFHSGVSLVFNPLGQLPHYAFDNSEQPAQPGACRLSIGDTAD